MTALRILILCLFIPGIYGCSTEEDFSSPVEPSVKPLNNVYYAQNQWNYAQMNQHYLWREDHNGYISCNFDQAPNEFFASLLSDKDRYSYMLTWSSFIPPSGSSNAILYQLYKDNNVVSSVLHVEKSMICEPRISRWVGIPLYHLITTC